MFGFVFVHAAHHTSIFSAVIGLIVNAIPAVYYLLNKRHLRTPYTEISFFISAVLWLFWGNYAAAILMVVFSLLGFFANKKLAIIFSAEGIEYPSFPVKHYNWTEVDQVILKDEILTIDLKNNKLMQFNINKAAASQVNEQQFNQFSKEMREG